MAQADRALYSAKGAGRSLIAGDRRGWRANRRLAGPR